MLPDVRQAVARLVRRQALKVDESASNSERWVRFIVEGVPERTPETKPGTPAP